MNKLLLFLLTLISFLLSEDIYPNFSDPSKQLKFEKKRIYTKQVSESKMILSGGGSKINPFYFLNDYIPQPLYIQRDIKTDYQYEYSFEISQNNKVLNEVDFLYSINLNDEADIIIEEYKKKLDKYNNELSIYNDNIGKKLDYHKLKRKKIIENAIVVFGSGALAYRLNYDYYNSKNLYIIKEGHKYPTKSINKFIENLGLFSFTFSLPYFIISTAINEDKISTLKRIKKPNPPLLSQSLSADQIIALADSYNRKIFNEIKNEN